MFQGTAYLISVLLTGLLLGAVLVSLLRSRSDSEIARGFYWVTAFLLSVSFTVNICMMLGYSPKALPVAARIAGSLLSALFASIFGVAMRRTGPSHLLHQPEVLDAIRMTVALTFAIAGIGKAFNMPFMTQFFTQSGYSLTFLHFIMLSEVLGAVGFLLPWAFLPALLSFGIDMFGAIVTHVHNGDPLGDSAGAIGMLIRLVAIAALLVIAPRGSFARLGLRSRVIISSFGAAACLGVAIIGSALLHAGR